MLNLVFLKYILDSEISLCNCCQNTIIIINIKIIYILTRHSDNEDNISQGSNQSFCEDQKGSNNIICKKDSDKYELKQNEAHKIDCHEDLKCKPSDDDEKKE